MLVNTISEYDIVRITAAIPSERVDNDFSGATLPRIGDIATVVMAHAAKRPLERCFIVECVGQDGVTIWLADVFSSEFDWVSSGAIKI